MRAKRSCVYEDYDLRKKVRIFFCENLYEYISTSFFELFELLYTFFALNLYKGKTTIQISYFLYLTLSQVARNV